MRALMPFLALSLAAAGPGLEAPLRSVRIYPDQAWMLREARVDFDAPGTQRLRIPGLPAGLSLEDLRVQAEGLPGLRLGNVAVVQEQSRFEPDTAWKQLEQERLGLEKRAEELDRHKQSIETAMTALESLRNGGPDGDSKAALDPKQLAELTRAFEAQRADQTRRGLAISEELSGLQARNAEVRNKQAELERGARQASAAVVVELEAPRAGRAQLRLELRTPQARWKPRYELRLSEDQKRLELMCYAALSQTSGQDWKGVQLEISNAQPSRLQALPQPLPPVQVAYEAPEALGTATISGLVADQKGQPLGNARLEFLVNGKVLRTTLSDGNGAFRLPLLPPGAATLRAIEEGFQIQSFPMNLMSGQSQSFQFRLPPVSMATVMVTSSRAPMDAVNVTSAQSGVNLNSEILNKLPVLDRSVEAEAAPAVEALEPAPARYEESGELGRAWTLEGNHEVLADGHPRRFLLARAAPAADLHFVAVPRASTEVYMVARLRPEAGFPWFLGTPVTIFRGGERLGQMGLPSASGQAAAFSFGPVAGLRVQRQRVESKVATLKGGRSRQWTLRERVVLSNDSDREVSVEVSEPLLQSGSDKVRIEALPEASPGSETRQGRQVWTVQVPARGQARVDEAWRISCPAAGYIPELAALGLPTSD